MKRQKRKEQDGEFNFWQPATDMMTGLVFILLLIIMLLGLYLLDSYGQQEELNTNSGEVESIAVVSNDYNGYDDHDGGDGWYNEGGGDGDGDGDYIEPPRVGGGGGGYDEGVKSAVYAELVDDETDRVIPVEDINFELYRTDITQLQEGTRQTLYTYYPNKIEYRKFATTKSGTFYLPEKIWQGSYFFRALNAPEGYDLAPDTYFDISELYDWPDPYVVQLRVTPCKNIICVQVNDIETEQAVGNAAFRVIAAEDVKTADGTVRYTEGQSICLITCDENGYGESQELYLGKYSLQQTTVPEYYASVLEVPVVDVERKDGDKPDPEKIGTEKTKAVITLSDELYPEQKIEGATFLVTNKRTYERLIYITDSSGCIYLTDLNKNTEYTVQQQQSADNYKLDATAYSINIGTNGRVNGQSVVPLDITNRVLRVSVSTIDAVLHSETEGEQLALYDSAGTLIESWATSGSRRTFTGLSEGDYYILRGDDESNRYDFSVQNTAEVQNWDISIFTIKSLLAIIIGAAAIIAMIWLLVFLIGLLMKRRSEKKAAIAQQQSEDEDEG